MATRSNATSGDWPNAIDDAVPSGDDLADELAAANDRLLRLQAEMQNLRNRTSREIADERATRPCRCCAICCRCVDNIDRAIEAAEKAGEAENLLAGFRLVQQQLHTILSRHQCEPIAAAGQPFDPNFHQAILQQPSADVPAGTRDDGHAAGLQAARPRGAAGAGDCVVRARREVVVRSCAAR